ncbi:hypothetical protein, partial [Nonomuraea sp. NPDC003201]
MGEELPHLAERAGAKWPTWVPVRAVRMLGGQVVAEVDTRTGGPDAGRAGGGRRGCPYGRSGCWAGRWWPKWIPVRAARMLG